MKFVPKEKIENTSIVYSFHNTTRSKRIYSILLISIIIGIVSLPFIDVNIYTSTRGIVKSDQEKITLQVIVSGNVSKSIIQNNLQVKTGDTLLVIENNIKGELRFLEQKINDATLSIHDLKLLLSDVEHKEAQLQYRKYQLAYPHYLEKLKELETRLQFSSEKYNTQKQLYEEEVIAKVEYNKEVLAYQMALNAKKQIIKEYRYLWEKDLIIETNNLKELRNRYQINLDKQKQYVLVAPMNGTIINSVGISAHSLITAGTKLAELSPSTTLIVESYVSPKDIGLIDHNSATIYQIDAFNYNQWGVATGQIIHIGKDIELVNNEAVFKIQSHLDQSYLSLSNGVKGSLKKGMTLTAQFKLTQRSLFDLLYDNINDWLNPNNIK